MKGSIMNEMFEATPINVIKNSSVKWQISYDIYPIKLQHAIRVVELIADDEYFEDFDVYFVSQSGRVTSIVLKAEKISLDLTSICESCESRLNELIDRFLDDNGGYQMARA
jgi:hypothetical protein